MTIRKLLSVAILTILVGIIPGFTQTEIINLDQVFSDRGEVYFKFENPGQKQLMDLTKLISIDELNEFDEIFAYANKKEFDSFLELGIEFNVLTAPGLLHQVKMKNQVNLKETNDWDYYPTYEAYVDIMYQFETNYPNICDVFSIGLTNEGREILVAKISDNISQNEGEAQFLYTGTMHGDETAGYVLSLRLIDYLLSSYGSNQRIDNMVDGLEIWINPLANPDGTYHSGNNSVNGATRYNSNNVDLNRNYPDPEDGPHPDGNEWQTETLLFMQMAENNHFSLSVNTHGGAEVCNYPWDTWPDLAADDDWWQFVCHEYADTAHAHAPGNYMEGFDDGITNGYAWYTTSGCRQDYMNYFQQCREFTLELSDTKLLPASQLPEHWEYNYRSFLNYIEQALYGVRGIVTDASTGNPVYAEVFIDGHDMDSSWVYSLEESGNYYRLLFEGTYDITFAAYGYFPQTIENVEVLNYESTLLNVQLENADLIADFSANENSISPGGSVDFTDLSFGDVISWEWEFEGGEPATSNEQNPTVVYNEIGAYDVSLKIFTSTDSQTILKEDYIEVFDQYFMQNGTFTISSGQFFDSGGPVYNYDDNEDLTMTFLPDSPDGKVAMEFMLFLVEYDQNCDYDWLKIFDGSDVQSTLIGTYCGGDSPGTIVASNAEGALTFQFHSDYSVNESGWFAQISVEGNLLPPMAEFCSNDSSIALYNSIEFTDLSENSPEQWDWYFEGGTPETSTDQNPEIMYENEGVFDVTLTVTNEAGSNTITKENFIEVENIVGLNETKKELLTVYPNPVNNKLFVQSESKIEHVYIFDLLGKKVLSVSYSNGSNSINLSSLNEGVYFLNIQTVSNNFSKKIQVIR